MAERRMFAKSIIDSDAFLDMPLSTQALYFHLSMRADDDGFVNNPKKIARMLGTGDDEFKVLFTKKFLISFDCGVVVIKHWKIHNYIAKDRYIETKYKEQKSTLAMDENNAYTHSSDHCIQPVYKMLTQDRLGKDRLGKESKEKNIDIFCNSDFQKTFTIYSENCKNLLPLLFERRNKDVLTLLGQVLEEIDYDFEQFKELCIKANKLEKIVNSKIDFKSMLKNYIGILSGKYETDNVIDVSKIDFS